MGIFIFILGLCIGSFLNVCIYRLPKQISLIKPASFCPRCNTPIKWYDNVPLLSYVLLSGRCRSCKETISLRYPLVELITGLVFFFLYIKLGFGLELFKYIFLFCLFIIISFIDIDYFSIPVYLCFIGIMGGLIFSLVESLAMLGAGGDLERLPLFAAFKGLVFVMGWTYLFKLFSDVFLNIYLYLRKKDSIEGEKEALGLGDVDFMGLVGVFFGIKAGVLVFFIAPFLGIVYSVYALIFKKSHLIPYLPYLSSAAIIVFFWGDRILSILF